MRRVSLLLLIVITLITGCGSGRMTRSTFSSAIPQTSATWFDCNSNKSAEAVGVNINNLGFTALQSPELVSALQQSGAGWIRISLNWGWIERQPGKFDWQAVDNGLSTLRAAHINALITLYGPVPCWALPTTQADICISPKFTVPPMEAWVDFVTTAVKRYKGQVDYWEIWNEPDLIQALDVKDPTQRLIQYRDNILIPASQAVHQQDPNAKVVGPAFAAIPSGYTAKGPQLEAALSLVLKAAAANVIDVVSLHSYSPVSLLAKVSSARTAMSASGMADTPIWITEIGDGASASNTLVDYQNQQAQVLSTSLSDATSVGGPQKVFWFALTDSADIAGNHTNHFGLISNEDYKTYAWTPRASFVTLQTKIQSACR